MNKKQLIVACLVILLSKDSIAIQQKLNNDILDILMPEEFVVGQTTKQQVEEYFGRSTTVRRGSNGEEVWVFDNIKVEYKESGKEIPEAKEFILKFNEKGILIDYKITGVGE